MMAALHCTGKGGPLRSTRWMRCITPPGIICRHTYMGFFNSGSEVFVPRLVWLSMSRESRRGKRKRKKATMVVLGNLNHVEKSDASRLRVPLPLMSARPSCPGSDQIRWPAGRVDEVQEGVDGETARLQCASFGVALQEGGEKKETTGQKEDDLVLCQAGHFLLASGKEDLNSTCKDGNPPCSRAPTRPSPGMGGWNGDMTGKTVPFGHLFLSLRANST